ncbi:hypothetical protein P7K49_040010 [Saguinus oedipus]|uniref:Uncharacterized protein n=1 Tax=Saguinus oedipus TaxID=9490 RepID=A0ABQ9TCJ3_SAGOE|nr:hypothetical protein P7K49_040059 [Saguinus oedipus]KAK2082629.1 hypothetical protein P7K49_040010 [Saguinus oedipus]
MHARNPGGVGSHVGGRHHGAERLCGANHSASAAVYRLWAMSQRRPGVTKPQDTNFVRPQHPRASIVKVRASSPCTGAGGEGAGDPHHPNPRREPKSERIPSSHPPEQDEGPGTRFPTPEHMVEWLQGRGRPYDSQLRGTNGAWLCACTRQMDRPLPPHISTQDASWSGRSRPGKGGPQTEHVDTAKDQAQEKMRRRARPLRKVKAPSVEGVEGYHEDTKPSLRYSQPQPETHTWSLTTRGLRSTMEIPHGIWSRYLALDDHHTPCGGVRGSPAHTAG